MKTRVEAESCTVFSMVFQGLLLSVTSAKPLGGLCCVRPWDTGHGLRPGWEGALRSLGMWIPRCLTGHYVYPTIQREKVTQTHSHCRAECKIYVAIRWWCMKLWKYFRFLEDLLELRHWGPLGSVHASLFLPWRSRVGTQKWL